MLKLFNDIKYTIKFKIEDITYKLDVKRCERKYEDYKEDVYNCGSFKFIWGLKAWDDLHNSDANLYTMNDIDISYDREEKLYHLGIETAYIFKNKQAECNYLKHLLNAFTQYMKDNSLSTETEYMTFMSDLQPKLSATSLEELYTNFRIIVTGFCGVYESE